MKICKEKPNQPTPLEQYKRLKKINPLIELLRKLLKLEL